MSFLIWLAGMIVLYFVTGWLWNGKGPEYGVAALLVYASWTVICIVGSIISVVRHFIK